MRATKLVFSVLLVSVLILCTTFAASAGGDWKITGAMKAVYEETGYNWLEVNVKVSPDREASGFMRYKSYVENVNEQGGWIGEPVCVSFGEYEGMPAATIVIRFTGGSYFPVGQYAKGLFVDGGKNATQDLIGMIMPWPPTYDQPGCEFEMPFFTWSGVGGNLTIHSP